MLKYYLGFFCKEILAPGFIYICIYDWQYLLSTLGYNLTRQLLFRFRNSVCALHPSLLTSPPPWNYKLSRHMSLPVIHLSDEISLHQPQVKPFTDQLTNSL